MAAGKEVEMEMGNGFATVGPVVDDDAETVCGVAFLPRDFTNFEHEMSEKCLIFGFRKSNTGEGFLWDKEKVNGSLRGDVAEAETEVIFIDDVGRNFEGDDFFKESGFLAHWSRVR